MSSEQTVQNPRAGLAGILDRFVGPGATSAELALQLVFPLGAAAGAAVYAADTVGNWSTVQYILCAALAFDIVGGIVTNATSSGKRWYHRKGQGFPQHFGFITLHLGHLALVSWAFLGFDFVWLITAGAYLLVAGFGIIMSPLYLQRPVALLIYAGSVLLALYGLTPPIGMEWFLPLFYLKLFVAHLPKEKAYRPNDSPNVNSG